jgi:predicted transcriptional regulator
VDFATSLRVSQKTFARYETGQATQSYAMDDLLRILQKYPETMQVFTEQIQSVQQLQHDPNALLEA